MPLTRVAVLVKVSATRLCQTRVARREMVRHPVESDVQPRLMCGIHEVAEIIASLEVTDWRIYAGELVIPATIGRMLVNWQQFEAGKARLFGVRH